jgi:hypothetical protein
VIRRLQRKKKEEAAAVEERRLGRHGGNPRRGCLKCCARPARSCSGPKSQPTEVRPPFLDISSSVNQANQSLKRKAAETYHGEVNACSRGRWDRTSCNDDNDDEKWQEMGTRKSCERDGVRGTPTANLPAGRRESGRAGRATHSICLSLVLISTFSLPTCTAV